MSMPEGAVTLSPGDVVNQIHPFGAVEIVCGADRCLFVRAVVRDQCGDSVVISRTPFGPAVMRSDTEPMLFPVRIFRLSLAH